MQVTRESFWENDFSLPDELHYKPFDARDDKSASTVLLANQKCSSSTLFGPKRPISRLIGSSDANSNDLQSRFVVPNSTSGSTRNKILAASLNFGKPSQGSSLVSHLASARPYIQRQATIVGLSQPMSRSPFSPSQLQLASTNTSGKHTAEAQSLGISKRKTANSSGNASKVH